MIPVKRKLYIMTGLLLFALVLCLSGCARYNTVVIPPQGLLFSNIKAPISTDFENTPAGVRTAKVSQSATYYFRDIIFTGMDFSWGDVSVDTIARMGGLNRVFFADYEYLNILGVYAHFKINVYGSQD